MSIILQTCCQIQRTFFSLRCLNRGPCHNQCNYSSRYSGLNIQQNVVPLLLEIRRQFSVRHTANLVPIQRTSSRLRYVNCGAGHIQCIYSSTYSGFNIQMNVSALLFYICRQFSERYTANVVPNITHIHQITLSELWSRSYTMKIQFRTLRLKYSTERISADIGDITTIQCALYSKPGASTAHNLKFTQCEPWSRPCTV
jgi:hypothetical protein